MGPDPGGPKTSPTRGKQTSFPSKDDRRRLPQCRPCLWQQSRPRVPGPARSERILRHLERWSIKVENYLSSSYFVLRNSELGKHL
jgi:hypothetical protein